MQSVWQTMWPLTDCRPQHSPTYCIFVWHQVATLALGPTDGISARFWRIPLQTMFRRRPGLHDSRGIEQFMSCRHEFKHVVELSPTYAFPCIVVAGCSPGLCVCLTQDAADRMIDVMTSKYINRVLPGTGRPPDCELIADGGSVGKYFSRARDSLLLIGLTFSTPHPPYSESILLSCANEGSDGRRAAQVNRLTKALKKLDPRWDWLKQRIAVACADGALVRGGPSAKHSSTCAMNSLFDAESDRALWDAFHLVDKV